MPTTDVKLALIALDVLGASQIPHALIHGAEALLDGGQVSDLDLVVDRRPDDVIAETMQAFASRGLLLVAVSPYDLGGARTAWYIARDGTSGLQIDLLYDIEGLGRLRVRSPALLAGHRPDGSPPIVSLEARLVYLWQKGLRKRQLDRLAAVADAARRLSPDNLIKASLDITGSHRAALEMLGLRRPGLRLPTRHPLLEARRLIDRIRQPVGFWVHVESSEVAQNVAAAFGQLLPRIGLGTAPTGPARIVWFWRRVQPIRLRPGLYVSYGPASGRPRPDLLVEAATRSERAIALTVSAMGGRYLRTDEPSVLI